MAISNTSFLRSYDSINNFICFYSKYYGFTHPLTGLLHLKLAKILLYQENTVEAVKHLKKSNEILLVTHGRTSSLYKEELLPLLFQTTIS